MQPDLEPRSDDVEQPVTGANTIRFDFDHGRRIGRQAGRLRYAVSMSIRALVAEVRAALNAKLYSVAIFTTMSLPDICGAIDSETGFGNGPTFAKWFDEYVGAKYMDDDGDLTLTGEYVYRLRCSLLHQGKTGHAKAFDRVLFIAPNPRMSFHQNVMDGSYSLDLAVFCEDVLSGVESWLAKVEGSSRFADNTKTFFGLHPQGLSPGPRGVPTFA